MSLGHDYLQHPHQTHLDPLLDCLVFLTKLNGHPYTKESLKSGLPLVNNCLTPSLFLRSAKRAGMAARIVKHPLKSISPLILPVVLILNNEQSCVLLSIDNDTAQVVFPETDEGETSITTEKLEEQYTGYSIFVKALHNYESRADEHRIEKPKSWFWTTIFQYKKNYMQVAVASFLVNLFALASPMFVMNVYDRVIPNNAVETLWALSTGIILVFFFDFVLKYLRGYLIDISGKKSDTLLASMIMQQILSMRMEHKPQSVGGFSNQINGYESLREFFTSATLAGVIDLPFIFLFLWFISFIGGSLVYVPMLAIPIVIVASVLLEIPIRRSIEKSFFGSVQKQALLIESIGSLETIKSLNTESQLQRKWENYVSQVARATLKSKMFSSLATNFTSYVIQMVTVVTVIYGVHLIELGELSMGGLIACSLLSGRTLAPLAQIASIITRYQQSRLGLQGLNKIMATPTERDKASQFLHRPTIKGKIEFKGVNFTYPNQKQVALENINFTLNPGERLAIIGRIGSGKTTLQKLILGLYEAQEGSVRIDDTDIAQIDPADLRRHIGYVGQDNMLFYGSVRDNITASTPWASDEAILKACEIAGVADFIHKHPSGYDMITGERGECLSNGQRQTIAIARALLSDPTLLLFDEPTSAMDHTSEATFLERMKDYTQDKTLILITHKQNLLDMVDRVIIMDNGKIAVDGPKEKVLKALLAGQVKVEKN